MATLNSNTRTTATEVKEIFDTSMSDDLLNNFINMAAERVDDIEDADTNDELTDTRLELIEMNVAAHYASTRDPRVSSEAIGNAEFSYKGAKEVTDYWRTALDLDTTDTLTGDSKPTASVSVLDGRNMDYDS